MRKKLGWDYLKVYGERRNYKMSKVEQWNSYKSFCKKNGLKENNFNSMKEWIKNLQ